MGIIQDPPKLRLLLLEFIQLNQVVGVDRVVEKTIFVSHVVEWILWVHPEANPRAQTTLLLLNSPCI